jgi:hypothetical protein
MTDESRYRGVYAGHAACGALRVAIDDEPVGLADQGLDQYDLDAEEQDTAFLASLAFGGGDEGEAAYRPELRRDFWQWYLDEAVPAAWRSV